MARTLTQAALAATTQLEQGVIETFILNSPVLDRLPLKTVSGNAYAYNLEATLPGVAFRAINGSYTESTGTINQKTETLCAFGGDADTDRFIVQTMSNINDQRAVDTAAKVKALAFGFQDAFFNGSTQVDTNSFDGLKVRLTGDQVITAATNGLPVVGSGESDALAFFAKLDELVGDVEGLDGTNGAIYANRAIIAKIRAAARSISHELVMADDIAGKKAPTWQGIPIWDAGSKATGTPILPITETTGTSNVTSSIYAVKFGEDVADRGVTGLTNGGVMVDDLGLLDEKPSYRTRIEFYCGLAVFGGKAAARLTGILNG